MELESDTEITEATGMGTEQDCYRIKPPQDDMPEEMKQVTQWILTRPLFDPEHPYSMLIRTPNGVEEWGAVRAVFDPISGKVSVPNPSYHILIDSSGPFYFRRLRTVLELNPDGKKTALSA